MVNIHYTITDEETFSSDSEVFTSELLENLEEMFPLYCMHRYMFSMFKSSH